MYRDRLYIDGADVYLEYGAFVVGSLKDLVAFPPMKAVRSNDWADEDGIDPDLSETGYRVDVRSLSFQFGFHGRNKDVDGFVALLSDGVYHTFYFKPFCSPDSALRPRLRLVSNPKMSDAAMEAGRLGTLTLKFTEDNYAYEGAVYDLPAGGMAPADGYVFNGRPLSDYGVAVLKGSLDAVRKLPDTKQNLLVKRSTADGAVYDTGGDVYFKSKDVKLTCLLRANDAAAFWARHQTLFRSLTVPGGHTLAVTALGDTYPCYYKNCTVSEFYTEIGGVVWMKFSLTFTLCGEFRRGEPQGVFLADEDGDFVTTEAGGLIDMRDYAPMR